VRRHRDRRNFPDALAAAPLADACGGPLLMTKRDSLPATVAVEIARLGASEAIIAGEPAL